MKTIRILVNEEYKSLYKFIKFEISVYNLFFVVKKQKSIDIQKWSQTACFKCQIFWDKNSTTVKSAD